MSETKVKHRQIRCPSCGRPCEYVEANVFRPFCSERCKTADIAAWASDKYAVPGEPISEEAAELLLVGNDDEIPN